MAPLGSSSNKCRRQTNIQDLTRAAEIPSVFAATSVVSRHPSIGTNWCASARACGLTKGVFVSREQYPMHPRHLKSGSPLGRLSVWYSVC